MKIILNLTVAMIIVLITSACYHKRPDIIVIGTQTWTTKNLDVDTFRNGEAIPEAKTFNDWQAAGDNNQPAWCYYENDVVNGNKYGKLYNWYAVNDARGLSPSGWHIPTDLEWTVLFTFLGGNEAAGKKMKSSSGWSRDGNGTNSIGFTGLPSGSRNYYGAFGDVGYFGSWWSASETNGAFAWIRFLDHKYINRNRSYCGKSSGLSVRCVKN